MFVFSMFDQILLENETGETCLTRITNESYGKAGIASHIKNRRCKDLMSSDIGNKRKDKEPPIGQPDSKIQRLSTTLCIDANKQFNNALSASDDLKATKSSYRCKYCQKSFPLKKDRNSHERQSHPNGEVLKTPDEIKNSKVSIHITSIIMSHKL